MWQPCVITATYGDMSGWEEELKFKFFSILLQLKTLLIWVMNYSPMCNGRDRKRLKTSSGFNAHEPQRFPLCCMQWPQMPHWWVACPWDRLWGRANAAQCETWKMAQSSTHSILACLLHDLNAPAHLDHPETFPKQIWSLLSWIRCLQVNLGSCSSPASWGSPGATHCNFDGPTERKILSLRPHGGAHGGTKSCNTESTDTGSL